MPKAHELKFESRSEENFPDLVALITALATYEKLPPPDEAARERLREHGLGQKPGFEAKLARLRNRYVGYLIYFQTYSSFHARPSLYLEDIFVLEEFRGKGIGSKLLKFTARRALKLGCCRMEWTALDWNTPAHNFYKKNGARKQEWSFFRLSEEEMKELVDED